MKCLEICRIDWIWSWKTQAKIVGLSDAYLIFYEFSKIEIIFVWWARKMIFRLENWNIPWLNAPKILSHDSYEVADSISIKFERWNLGWKLIKTARGTPWKTFSAHKMKCLENCRKDSIWPWLQDARIIELW